MDSPRHAYIDESRLRIGDGSQNLYLMVAVVVPGHQILAIQRQLRELLPAGVKRLHWREDRPSLRRKHLRLLADLHAAAELDGFQAHAFLARARREVAGRQRCLAALAGDLAARGVEELVIESRQRHRDRDDDRVLLRARGDGVIPDTLQWRYGRPHAEPLLWAPDAIAGAVGHALVGRDHDGLADLVPPGLRRQVWAGEV
jgi:hypothetical protein